MQFLKLSIVPWVSVLDIASRVSVNLLKYQNSYDCLWC